MIFIHRRKTVVFVFFSLLFLFSVFFANREDTRVFSPALTKSIIIDAGHGLPDGGAIGMTGTIESELNLEIAKIVEKYLTEKGYTVIMTRKDEKNIAENGKTIGEKKKNDMHKRLEIINSSSADIFVSIHMNKFSQERYSGAQVIYSDNFRESSYLAGLIQEEFHHIPEIKEKRSPAKAPGNIFLLNKATIPSVIVECGFLSNYDEEKRLNTKEYQNKIATAIVKGIEKYYSAERSTNNENLHNR